MTPLVDTSEHKADPRIALHKACDVLSGRDEDRASERNDVGWNGTDSRFGHILADTEPTTWTPRMTEIAVKMLQKYRAQLAATGFAVESIPTMDAHARRIEIEQSTIAVNASIVRARNWRVDYDATRKEFVVVTPYAPEMLGDIRALPGRMWNPTGDKTNRVPALTFQHAVSIQNFAAKFNLILTESAEAAAEGLIADTAKEVAQVNESVEASQAHDAEISIAGLGGELRPFQRAGVKYALDHDSRVLIADEMGLGKTVEALAIIAHHLSDSPLTRAIIVCPASLKLNWSREAIKWLPEIVTVEGDSLLLGRWGRKRVRGLTILNGKRETEMRLADGSMAIITNNDLRARILVINYDILDKHAQMFDALKAQGVVRIVVFDESHYAKSVKARRTKLSQALAEDVPARLCLTGTPVMNRPKELISQLNILGRLNDFGGFHAFVRKYCQVEYVGQYAADPAGLLDLNRALRATCFVRRRKIDVLTELPPKVRTMIPVEITNRAEYDRAEKELIAYIRDRAMRDATFLAEIADWPAEEQQAEIARHADDKAERASRAEVLVRINTLKQIAARGMLPAIVEWVEDFLDSEKLVLFAWHREIVTMMGAHFNAPTIMGGQPLPARDKAVASFQTDENVRLIVSNVQSGGVGLTLTAASNVAMIELGWNAATMDQAEDRVHRIGQHDSVTAWYFIAQGTIYEKIARLIEQKRRVAAASTDGIMSAKIAGQSILGDLVRELLGD